jgi:hypothetical protein
MEMARHTKHNLQSSCIGNLIIHPAHHNTLDLGKLLSRVAVSSASDVASLV